jgi:hypothetical protein
MTAGTAILRTCCRLVTASRSAVACRTSQPTASCDCYKRSAGLLGLTRKQSSLCVAVVPGGHEKICRLVGFIATNSTAGIRSDEGTNRVGLALELSFSGVEKALPALAASNRPSSKTARACASTAALPRRVPAVVQSGGYAIVDRAIIRTAAVRWTEERRSGELLHNELHNRISRWPIAKIARKFDTERWPSGRWRRS